MNSTTEDNANAMQVPIGPQVLKVLELAYRARRPLLLEGPTGVGKSQIVSEFAQTSGLQIVILDLSLLEPPDLIGLPVIDGGRTHYASPAELPESGNGIIMLEELNRAEIPVMQPALQLLSARRLHSYVLPEGWTCVAAINPEDGDYQVQRLDPALRSRFLQMSVCAEREAWLTWATGANIHPLITHIVRDHIDVFDEASPRSWAYASDLLHVLKPEELANPRLVRIALRGYLPASWSILATNALADWPEAPHFENRDLLGSGGPDFLAGMVTEFESAKRSDAVAMLASKIRRDLINSEELLTAAGNGTVTMSFLEKLFASLPGDLREQCLYSAVESSAAAALFRSEGCREEEIATAYRSSPLREQILNWRSEMKVHRIRLVVVAMLQWLKSRREALPESALEELGQLTADAGPPAIDLDCWLSARTNDSDQ